MGASFGKLGVEHPAPDQNDPDTFEWFGSTVRVIAEVNEIELIDLMDAARDLDAAGLAGLAALKDAFRMLIHPEDFDGFWKLAKANRQKTEDLAQVFQVLVQGATDRPTRQPSDSSAGPLVTAASSPAVSVSEARPGRPDLQIIHEDAALQRERMARALVG